MTGRIPQHPNTDRKLWKLSYKFVDLYLKQDGVFILRLIAHNTNQIVTNDIIASLWDKWIEKMPEDKRGLLHGKDDYASDATDDNPY